MPDPATTNAATPSSVVHEPLALVGLACRVPGGDGLDQYWELLADGGSAIGEMTPELLDRDLYYSPTKGNLGKTYSTLGGLIANRPLDADIAALPTHVIADADPCHQILCETAGRALRHAGYDPFQLPAADVGIYVGHSGGSPAAGETAFGTNIEEILGRLHRSTTFRTLPTAKQQAIFDDALDALLKLKPARRPGVGRRREANSAATVIAEAFALSGPRHVIDAACASSLVALHSAALALQLGEIDAALVCGASYNKADSLILFSQAQSCSDSGTRPFDAAADGLIGSEGYVACLVKTLAKAEADGDVIHAVIRGIGVSSDGRGRSLWAPRTEGQLEAVRRAYGPDVDPATIQYVEMHATSTQVGDATEISALAEFFKSRSPADGPSLDRRIPIGSVKSNIGHTLETAGLAGLLKVVLAMKRGVIPASINVRELNRDVDWDRLPFEVVREPIAWPAAAPNTPRRAAVNAFGIGGLNVHTVVEEYLPGRPKAQAAARPQPMKPPVAAREPIAVVGRGVVVAGAFDLAAFRELCASGRDAKSEAGERWNAELACRSGRRKRPLIPTSLGGYVRGYTFDWRKRKIPPKQMEAANPLQFMLLDAAEQALGEVKRGEKSLDKAFTSVVIGTIFGGDFGNDLHVGLRLPELRRELAQACRWHGLPELEILRIQNEFQAIVLRDMPALTDETGSFTSSTLASRVTKTFDLMGGALAVDAGDCSSTAALELAIQLLATRRSNAVLCAGAQRAMGLPTYETLELAGRLAGSRTSNLKEGYVPGEGVVVLLLKRLADARRDGDTVIGLIDDVAVASGPTPVDAISLSTRRLNEGLSRHGSQPAVAKRSVLSPDYALPEVAAAYHDALGGSDIESSPLLAQIGHTEAAHGLLELVRKTFDYEPSAARGDMSARATVDLATLADNGLAYLVKLSPAEIVAATASHLPTLTSATADLLFPSTSMPPVSNPPTIAAPMPDTVPPAFAAATVLDRPRRVVAMFPGQGSQYPQMLADIIDSDPAANHLVAQADQLLRGRGLPPFREFCSLADVLGTDVRLAQLGMLIGDLALYEALRAAGVRFDWVSGHSYGEFAALVAADAWTLQQAVDATLARAEAIASCDLPTSKMIAVSAAPLELQPLLAAERLMLFITHHNGPRQTVVAGEQREVERGLALLQRSGYSCRVLDVPRPYHTPLLKPAAERFRAALQAIPMRPPVIPILSNVTNRFVVEPEEIRENLVRQLTQPVQYVDLVQRLHRDGATLLVEVGPSAVLTGLHRRILSGLPVDVIACDDSATAAQGRIAQVAGTILGRTPPNPAAPSIPQLAVSQAAGASGTSLSLDARRPPEVVAAPPPNDDDAFDATKRRKERTRARAESAPVKAHGKAAPVAAPSTPPAPHAPAPVEAGSAIDVEAFLVNFVVDQTGYPPEIVELDADLEADLGIDSIKKAQLVGELREFFPTLAQTSLKLSDIRTLRQIKDVLPEAAVKSPTTRAAVLESSVAAPVPYSASADSTGTGEELERFLVDFVIDQTGYPREIVELDADLEADLGIDSIKKAQIFGELREQFSSEIPRDLKPSQLRTLRDFLSLFGGSPANDGRNSTPASEPLSSNARTADRPRMEATSSFSTGAAVAAAVRPEMKAAPAATPEPIRDRSTSIVEFSGDAYRIGLAHGTAGGEAIRAALRRYVDLPTSSLPDPIAFLCQKQLGTKQLGTKEIDAFFDDDELAELTGIAEGARVSVGNILAHNLILSLQENAGCVQFALRAAENGTLIHAANEDSPLMPALHGRMRGLIQKRSPSVGHSFVNLTIVGQASGINGANAPGLAVTSTKLLDRPITFAASSASHGRLHSLLVKRILSKATDIDSALEIIREFPRLGAWSLCLSHQPSDRLCYVEYQGDELRIRKNPQRVLTANHGLLDAAESSTGSMVPPHSLHRLERLKQLVADGERCDVARAKRILRDRFDRARGAVTTHPTMNTVCRVDNQVSLVMEPACGALHVIHGGAVDGADDYLTTTYDRRTSASQTVAPRSAAANIDLRLSPTSTSRRPLTSRYLLRMVERPHPSAGAWRPLVLRGGVVILGDNPYADAIERHLAGQERPILRLSDVDDPAVAIAALERFWSQGPAPHIFFTGPCDLTAATTLDGVHHADRRRRGLTIPFLVCQRWAKFVTEAGLTDDATLGALLRLGGDFGFSQNVASVESGGLAGLLKSFCIENWVQGFRRTPIKMLDVAPGIPPETVAQDLCRELANPSVYVEISYDGDVRRVIRAHPAPLTATNTGTPPIRRGAVWVCTGGARGITAFVARELARRYGAKLHLLGTSPTPRVHPEWRELSETGLKKLRAATMQTAQAAGKASLKAWQELEKAMEIDKTLREFAAEGIAATYHSCDVADRDRLAAVLEMIRRDDGPIEGILHGAGFGKDSRFDRKELENVDKCFGAKNDGAAYLMDLTRDDPLKHFIGFGSISGRFGANGHTDYSAANDMLAKQVDWFRGVRPDCRSVTFHWHAWDDFGMAVKPEVRLALEMVDIQFMPSREGLAHFISELEAGLPEPEVLITSAAYADRFQPEDVAGDGGVAPGQELGVWLETQRSETDDGLSLEKSFDPTREPFLVDHRLNDRPILPVVVGLEMLAEAAAALAGRKPTEFRDVDARQAVRFADDAPKPLRVRARSAGDSVECILGYDVTTRAGKLVEADRRCLSGTVVFDEPSSTSPSPASPFRAALTIPTTGWEPVGYLERPAPFYLGPTLRNLREVCLRGTAGFGRITAPSPADLSGSPKAGAAWLVPSALLDACLYAVGLSAWRAVRPGTALPKRFQSIRLGRTPNPGEACLVSLRLITQDETEATYDFRLTAADGTMLLDVTGYRIVWLMQG
jgi:acyl transferase domain-containing protein/NAD(P)-dependent dehydrogenase (short-subunit alcohol dehydrogenase family)/acyl carrier protein